MRVPETDLTVTLNDTFWQGERVPFEGPGADRGTLQRAASSLNIAQGEKRYTLVPITVQRVSGAGGLYLVVFSQNDSADRVGLEAGSTAFLGKNVRLFQLAHTEGVVTATIVDARLGRPPSAAMQTGQTYRFRLDGGRLLELD